MAEMTLEQVRARHQQDSLHVETPMKLGACYTDRAFLLAELERLREALADIELQSRGWRVEPSSRGILSNVHETARAILAQCADDGGAP